MQPPPKNSDSGILRKMKLKYDTYRESVYDLETLKRIQDTATAR